MSIGLPIAVQLLSERSDDIELVEGSVERFYGTLIKLSC